MKHINDLDIIAGEPNFTIVLPVDCSADCSFCSWRTSNQDKQTFNNKVFIDGLILALENLPERCTQITISGGEPSVYSELSTVMATIAYHKRKNIQKVVFTTNGQNILKLSNEKWFTDVVDYVNISRHDFNQDDNDRIMGIKTITWGGIKKASKRLGNAGIPTNINCVLSDSITTRYSEVFINEFIKLSRKNFINSITFRRDYDDGFGVHPLESFMGKSTNIGECPVCRKSRYIVNGMEVIFTTSEFEPTEVLGDKVYEFILQPNGKLTTNWEGTDEVIMKTQDSVTDKVMRSTGKRPKKTKTIGSIEVPLEEIVSCTATRVKIKEKETYSMGCGGARGMGC